MLSKFFWGQLPSYPPGCGPGRY